MWVWGAANYAESKTEAAKKKKCQSAKVRHKQTAARFFFFFFALGCVPGMCPFSFVLRDQPINDSQK